MSDEAELQAYREFFAKLDIRPMLKRAMYGGFDSYEDYEQYGDAYVVPLLLPLRQPQLLLTYEMPKPKFDPYKGPVEETLRRLAAVGLTYERGPDDNRFDCCTQLIFKHADGTTWTWNGSWWSRESVHELWNWAKARYPVDESP